MAAIHPFSVPATKSELDLFIVPSTQVAIEETFDVQYLPFSAVSGNRRYEFRIPGAEEFIDLSSIYLDIDLKVVAADGTTAHTDAQKYTPVQYLLNTMFSQVDVFLGQTKITPSNDNYPYRSYMDTLLFSSPKARDTFLRNALWGTDTVRKEAVKTSTEVQLFGRMHIDLFEQPRHLIPLVPMNIIMNRMPDKFALKRDNGVTGTYQILISKIKLHIRKIRVNPDVYMGLSMALQKAAAKYFITRREVTFHNISIGEKTPVICNVFQGQLHRKFIVGFVSNSAYAGDIDTNPFEFGTHTITDIGADIEGKPIPGISYTSDWTKNKYSREYQALFRELGMDHASPTTGITWDEFKTGSTLFAFNLAPDVSVHGPETGIVSPVRRGNLNVKVNFGTAPTAVLTMIVYALYDNVIQIDHDRNVAKDW